MAEFSKLKQEVTTGSGKLIDASPSPKADLRTVSKERSTSLLDDNHQEHSAFMRSDKLYYRVASGDNPFKIARQYNVPLALLYQANPGLDSRHLKIGQELLIPHVSKRAEQSATPRADPQHHKIQPGETLYGLSTRYRVPLSEIVAANRGIDPTRLQPNQEVLIPGGVPVRHQIEPGDTLERIAKKHNLRTASMLTANPELDPKKLRIGEEVAVPRLSAQEQRDLDKMRSFVGKPYNVHMDCMTMVMRFAKENYGVSLPGGRSDLWVPHLRDVTTITAGKKDISNVKTGDICCIGHPYKGSISVFHNVLVGEPVRDRSGKVVDFTAIDAHGNYENGDRNRPFGQVREVPSLLSYLSLHENSKFKSHAFIKRVPAFAEATAGQAR